jgi:hypothetical protein
MSKADKALEAIRSNSRNVAQHDFESLASRYGRIEEGGRHPKVIIGDRTMFYKRENPIKSCYTKELIEMIAEVYGL